MIYKNYYQKYLDYKNITYNQYLKSSHWIKTKEKFRKSIHFNNCCWVCGNKKKLNLHHTTYRRIGREWMNDLIELCSDCHSELHTKVKILGWKLSWAHVELLNTKDKKQTLSVASKDEIEKAERRGKLTTDWKWEKKKKPKKLTRKEKKEAKKKHKRKTCVVCGTKNVPYKKINNYCWNHLPKENRCWAKRQLDRKSCRNPSIPNSNKCLTHT